METAPAADLEEAVQALEERALERQARLEAALLQVSPFRSQFSFLISMLHHPIKAHESSKDSSCKYWRMADS